MREERQMNMTGRRKWLGWASVLSASLCVGLSCPVLADNDDDDDHGLSEAIEQAQRNTPRGKRPVVETHIHFWQVTRPGGVPFPGPENGPIFRDVLPPEYDSVARANGIATAGVVEA